MESQRSRVGSEDEGGVPEDDSRVLEVEGGPGNRGWGPEVGDGVRENHGSTRNLDHTSRRSKHW